MGIRSEVVVCMKAKLCAELTPEQRKLWFEDADLHLVDPGDNPGGELWKWDDVKWYHSFTEIKAMYDWLWEHEDDDYLVLVATSEYPEDNSDDYGCWHDNPWNAYKWKSCGVNLGADE
jgi:hypothetical protein